MRVFQTLSQKLTISALALSFLAIAPTRVSATAIPLGGGGVLQLNNMVGTLVGVSNACINWLSTAPCTNPPGSVQDSVSGQDPAVFTVGSTALDTIKDLPAGVVLPLVDFETVQSPLAGGVVHFDLTSIQLPVIPAGNNCATFALSAICSPGGSSPFTLFQQSADQVSITLGLSLIAYTGTNATNTPYNAVFTTQLSGLLGNGQTVTIPNILALEGSGGTITATWSATESPLAPVPEPSQFLVLGSGLIGLGLWRRRISQ